MDPNENAAMSYNPGDDEQVVYLDDDQIESLMRRNPERFQ